MTSDEWKDAPAWVVKTAVHEKWGEREWRHLELLKARFDELGVELDPSGNPPTGLRRIYAYWTDRGFAAGVELGETDKPLHEALHDLVNQVARLRREREQPARANDNG
jgi:hypothetical protein